MSDNSKIPVSILSGFLGAGKTTFLNQLIRENPQTEFVVLENEFGEISLDHEWVLGSPECIYEIKGGCICCSLNHELERLLRELVNQERNFDHLIIETSGVADPAGVASPFLSQQRRQSMFELDAVITLVDTPQVLKQLSQEPELMGRQIAFADTIVLNKVTESTPEQIKEVEQELQKLNPGAKIWQEGNLGNPLSIKAYLERNLEDKYANLPEGNHLALSPIKSHSFRLDTPLDPDKFKAWMYRLLNFQSENLYRVKGVLDFAGHPQKSLFQSVQKQYAIRQGSAWKSDEKRESRLVFIGKDLRKDILEKQLEASLSPKPFMA